MTPSIVFNTQRFTNFCFQRFILRQTGQNTRLDGEISNANSMTLYCLLTEYVQRGLATYRVMEILTQNGMLTPSELGELCRRWGLKPYQMFFLLSLFLDVHYAQNFSIATEIQTHQFDSKSFFTTIRNSGSLCAEKEINAAVDFVTSCGGIDREEAQLGVCLRLYPTEVYNHTHPGLFRSKPVTGFRSYHHLKTVQSKEVEGLELLLRDLGKSEKYGDASSLYWLSADDVASFVASLKELPYGCPTIDLDHARHCWSVATGGRLRCA